MTRQNMTFKILLVCMLHTETHSTLNMFNKYICWGFINNLKIIRTQLKHNHLTVTYAVHCPFQYITLQCALH